MHFQCEKITKFLMLSLVLHKVVVFCEKVNVPIEEYLTMPLLFHFDDFDRCLLHEKKALYCMITLQLAPENPNNTSAVWKTLQKVGRDWRYYRHDIIRHGVCIPEACPGLNTTLDDPKLSEKIENCRNAQYKKDGLVGRVMKAHCEGPDPPYRIGPIHIVFGVFVAAYVAFVVLASLYEGVARYRPALEYQKLTGTKTGQILCAFSLTKNWIRLKSVNLADPEVKFFRPVQGIRFYNMILVILMHTVMQNLASPVTNPLYVETITDKFMNIFLANGGYAVQTSFMLSSLFLTYNFLEMFRNDKTIPLRSLISAFFHRYVRLTPSLAFLVLFQATWLPLVSRGPFWDALVGAEHRRCIKNGWTNVLFINNFVNPKQMCLPQTWYMAVDTQFFMLALPAIYLIKKSAKWLPIIASLIVFVHITTLFGVIYWNNWESTIRPMPESLYEYSLLHNPKWHIILGSNYSNAAGLAAGLILGYVVHKYKNKPIFTTKTRVVVYWLLVWGLGLGIVLIPGLIIYSRDYQHNRLYAAIYGGVSRTVFITGIGVGVFGLCQGVGWWMKRTCEWYPTYVLGRLTYGAYLVHLPLIMVRSAMRRSPTYLNDHIMVTELISDVVLSYMGAVVMALLIELPVSQMQKVLSSNGNRKKTQKHE